MTVPIHSLRDPRHCARSLILLVVLAGIAGCASGDSPVVMVSPPGWVEVPSGGQHAKSATLTYIANGGSSSCIECHGVDLSGGTSKVSCFGNPAGCHHGPVADWVAAPPAAQSHGVAAKKAPGNSGFASCQICHGADFRIPRGDGEKTCYSCHSLAPHPNGPWRSSTGSTHTNTDPSNAPACAACHRNSNPGTPGCFNTTLCHGTAPAAAPHAVGTSWLDPNPLFHGLTAKLDLSFCQECHGTPGSTLFDGGSAPTSCQTSACHARAKAHPIPWHQAPQPFPAYAASHRDSGNRDAACAICHKVDGPGAGSDPAAPSCFSLSFNGIPCHSGGPVGVSHTVPFPGAPHTTTDLASFNADCSVCHAVTGVSPNSAAPLCAVCHQSAATLPFANCTSCHGDPPSGATYPNVAGEHAVHGALPGVEECNPCHSGLEAGTLEHYNRANARPGMDALRVAPGDVAFLAAYDAKSGPAAFTAANRTCSNVICHGGQETPDWQTATADAIDVPNACLSCHVFGTTQYNSYFSGEHASHIDNVFGLSATTCKLCHDAAKVNVSGHFDNLATIEFEQPARQTILPAVTYKGSRCNPQDGGLTGCHGNREW